jgi:hypothetical protein
VNSSHANRFAMIARTPAGSGWEAQCKVRALTALVELGEAAPIAEDELRRLLEDVADSPPPGARGAQARLAAMRSWIGSTSRRTRKPRRSPACSTTGQTRSWWPRTSGIPRLDRTRMAG